MEQTYSNMTSVEWNSSYTSDPMVDEFSLFKNVSKIGMTLVYGSICLLGTLGNSTVIYLTTCVRSMRNPTNVVIANLAICDLLFSVILIPSLASVYATGYWNFGNVWCKTMFYLTYVCHYARVYTLVLLTLDRLLVVMSVQLRTMKNTVLIILVVWAVIAICNIPVAFMFGTYQVPSRNDERIEICLNVAALGDSTVDIILLASFFGLAFVLALGIISVIFVLIIFNSHQTSQPSLELQNTIKRETRMVGVMVLVFFFCYLPQFIVDVWSRSFNYPIVSLWLNMASSCILNINHCINPLLYMCLSERFRNSFYQIFNRRVNTSDENSRPMVEYTQK